MKAGNARQVVPNTEIESEGIEPILCSLCTTVFLKFFPIGVRVYSVPSVMPPSDFMLDSSWASF